MNFRFFQSFRQLHALRKIRQQKLEALTENLLRDRPEEADKILTWVDKADKTLVKLNSGNKFFWPIFIAIICTFILGWGFRDVATTTVHIDLLVKKVDLVIAENFEGNLSLDLSPRFMDVSGIQELEGIIPTKETTGTSSQEFFQAESTDSLRLRVGQQMFAAGNHIAFEQSATRQSLIAKRGLQFVTCDIKSGVLISSLFQGRTAELAGEYPESFQIAGEANEGNSIDLNWYPFQNVSLRKIGTSDIYFTETSGDRPLSSIISGQIKLLSTNDTFDLGLADELSMVFDGLQEVQILKMTPNGIQIQLEANVSELSVGQGEFERSLMPSWIQYFRNDQQVAFIWSTIALIWGMLWSFKRTIL